MTRRRGSGKPPARPGVRVATRRMRDKLGDDPEHPRLAQTGRRVGCRFLPPGGGHPQGGAERP